LNIGGRGYFFDSRLAAWQAVTASIQAGQRSIDIGLMILVHSLVTNKDIIKQYSMLDSGNG